ncbi:malonate--CoA ligase [Amorphus orientalis]|uniref:3-methylmercaptopropionyl-CoA ligase n=1 Tax=Amorphus orientalis TaxID=649198 RepID=A0AAE3VNA3_9HYPH|nr:malonyl-CoA synthase [Amorphus orientalis]MDQ0315244.1 malonyl-CoA/methylmalonyl-CoA synthetase [Amorphus orientalis]
MSELFRRLVADADEESTFLIAGDRRITYREMEALTGQAAAALVALGVAPGDRVAVQIEKSVEGLFLYLAAIRAGAVYLPLNTAYTPAELDYFLDDAEPALFVCDPAKLDALSPVAEKAGVPRVETLDGNGEGSFSDAVAEMPVDGFRDIGVGGDDLAAILYTSGTTGRSKGAMITHENLASNAEALVELWQFGKDDVLLHTLPIFHVHGLFTATNTAMRAGAAMIFLPKFDVDAVLAALPQATVMMGVPTFYSRLLGSDAFDRDLVSGMRLFISGSAPLSPETHKYFFERTGQAILERYGMTETSMITSNPYDGARKPGTVGMPLPGVSVRIADPESGDVLPDGEVGVIEVSGPNVFKGYWKKPEKTAEEFRADGWFITGDLGYVDGDGYVCIAGRAKDLVISGGFNVYPAEIEAAIDALPGVKESAVIGVPHRDFGEGVTAVIAIKPGAHVSEEGIRSGLEGELASFKIPKRVVIVDELPRNIMGKVQKAALREAYRDLYGG